MCDLTVAYTAAWAWMGDAWAADIEAWLAACRRHDEEVARVTEELTRWGWCESFLASCPVPWGRRLSGWSGSLMWDPRRFKIEVHYDRYDFPAARAEMGCCCRDPVTGDIKQWRARAAGMDEPGAVTGLIHQMIRARRELALVVPLTWAGRATIGRAWG